MDNLIRVYDDIIDEDSCNMLITKFENSSDDYEEVMQQLDTFAKEKFCYG